MMLRMANLNGNTVLSFGSNTVILEGVTLDREQVLQNCVFK